MNLEIFRKNSYKAWLFFTLFFLCFQSLAFADVPPTPVPPPPPLSDKDSSVSDFSPANSSVDPSSSFLSHTEPVKSSTKKLRKRKNTKAKKKSVKKYPRSKRSKERAKTLSILEDREKLILFKWFNEQQVSFQWAYAFLKQKEKYAPKLLTEKIDDSFKNDMLFYLNFHQSIIQFPYVLKWGLRASAGMTRNYSIDSTYFIPMSLSAIVSLQIFEKQIILPFFEMGYSFFSVDFSESTDFFPFFSLGADISFSIFKSSLRYTLSDEYGIKDLGLSLELRNNSSPQDFPDEKRSYFLHSLHIGVYCKF